VWSALAIALAGTGAGVINTLVGSGTLITFPTLLFFGVNPLVANVSNNIGLVAGGATGSWGYRHELTGHASTLRRYLPLSFVGSVIGASLLLVLPPDAFKAIVPALILLAVVLVVLGPLVQRRARNRETGPDPGWHAPVTAAGILLAGLYGGYFGAAQGVLLIGLFSILSSEPLQRLNAYKNVLSLVVNFVAAIVFLIFAREYVDWLIVVLVAAGAFVGGIIGARIGRRIPPNALRALIVAIGTIAVVKLLWGS
jgi:uncharacterized membrane protein YfcA